MLGRRDYPRLEPEDLRQLHRNRRVGLGEWGQRLREARDRGDRRGVRRYQRELRRSRRQIKAVETVARQRRIRL